MDDWEDWTEEGGVWQQTAGLKSHRQGAVGGFEGGCRQPGVARKMWVPVGSLAAASGSGAPMFSPWLVFLHGFVLGSLVQGRRACMG